MLNLKISNFKFICPVIEIVERKGLGHPDTICDSIMDKISVDLAKFYLKKFGEVLHFNADKALLSAGETETKFGGGKVVKPMKLVIGDRATYIVNGEKLDLDELIEKSIDEWLKKNMRFVNRDNLIIQNETKQGSKELTSIFKKSSKFLPANDTSALVGYAPLTKLEKSVYSIEHYMNSKEFKKSFPETGEDVKVMGLKVGNDFTYTFAVSFVDRFIKNELDYFRKKEEVLEEIKNFFKKELDIDANVRINTLDEKGKGENGCFLTVTGTSAESADSGEVGRGNRVNGLIALNRPAGSEAAAGKNMVSHVGKIYNVLAFEIANDIYREIRKHTYVWLLSQIGRVINNPLIISIQVNNLTEEDKKIVSEIVESKFEHLDKFLNDLIEGKYLVY